MGHSKEICITNPASAVYGKSIDEARAARKEANKAKQPATGTAKPAVTNTIFQRNRIHMLLEKDD